MNELMQINFRIKLIDSFDRNVPIHGHSTRNKLNFHVQFCNTVLFQEGVVNRGIILYNEAPYSIKNWITLNSVKRIKILAFKTKKN